MSVVRSAVVGMLGIMLEGAPRRTEVDARPQARKTASLDAPEHGARATPSQSSDRSAVGRLRSWRSNRDLVRRSNRPLLFYTAATAIVREIDAARRLSTKLRPAVGCASRDRSGCVT
jgi:hypothetical protein